MLDYFSTTNNEAGKIHNYNPGDVAYIPTVASALPSGAKIIDKGIFRRAPVVESFTIASIPSIPLKLIVRYDSAVGGASKVYIDDKPVGTWELPRGQYVLNEASFIIPADFVTGNKLNIRLEWSKGISTFQYWAYATQ